MSEKREIKIDSFTSVPNVGGLIKFGWQVGNEYSYSNTLHYQPTGNCQWFSITNLEAIIKILSKDEFWDLIDQLFKKAEWSPHKRLLFFDVYARNKDKLLEIFDNKIHTMQEYTSTYDTNYQLIFGTGFNPLFK